MLELRRAKTVDVDLRIFFPDVMEQLQVPIEPEFRMVPALHQDLHAAGGSQLIELLVELLVGQDVMILILFRAIKRTELAIDVADVGVIDVSIDDVGDDLAFLFRQIAPRIGQRAQLSQRPAIKLECFGRRNAFAAENLLLQSFAIQRNHRRNLAARTENSNFESEDSAPETRTGRKRFLTERQFIAGVNALPGG